MHSPPCARHVLEDLATEKEKTMFTNAHKIPQILTIPKFTTITQLNKVVFKIINPTKPNRASLSYRTLLVTVLT